VEPKDTLAERQGRKQAEATRLPPVGFWSYARQDDQLSSGRLTALRSLLVQELQQQYGREPVRLFQDHDTITHGSDWEDEIKKAIDASTFFIPIITPNFVQSEWCCREVELFIEREKTLRARHPELAGSSRIFPILFIGIDDADPEEPAILTALQKLQWFDFRQFRHRSFDAEEIREALSKFAGTMRSLLKTRLGPTTPPSERRGEPAPERTLSDKRDSATRSASPTRIAGPTSAGSGHPSGVGPARPIEVGDVLNHMFEVKRFIKAGGMGQVFEGSNAVTGERVAIKALLPALAADPKVTQMFQREAMTLTRLSHEALVQYRAMAKEPALGVLYIVTEYVDGVDLGEALDQVDCDSGELERLLARLAAGLAAAHRLGAIHRDISPDNIMLPGGDLRQAKIIDFGIAKDLGGALPTLVGEGFAGKLSFVAPEQLGDHDGKVGSWTDVYSLALVILSVARGEKVDMAGSFADAIRKRREVPDLSAAPASLRPLLADMLRPDPADRVQTMDEVIARLAEARDGAEPVQPAKRKRTAAGATGTDADATIVQPFATAPAQAGDLQRRSIPWLWIGLGAAALVSLVVAILSLSRNGGDGSVGKASANAPTAPAPAPSRPPDRAWAYGRWCVNGNRNNVQTVSGDGNRIVIAFSGQRQPETVAETAEGSFRTDKATYRRLANGAVRVEDPDFPYTLERCR
jgi:serine/threonine protein kinase